MGTRELLILILGLAVIAVILRGLYVALNARRTQIRLSIDNNIPQDIDLEELEMAELPSGGARVVKRSPAAVNQQELDLDPHQASNEAVPILLDTVQIKQAPESRVATGDDLRTNHRDSAQEQPDWDDDANQEQDKLSAHDDSYDDDEAYEELAETDEDEYEDSRDRLVASELSDADDDDYDEIQGDEIQGDEFDDEDGLAARDEFDDDVSDFEVDEEDEAASPDAVADWEQDSCEPEVGQLDDDEHQEPHLDIDQEFDDELSGFSLTAGDRIGAPEDADDDRQRDSDSRRDSLFSRFGKKPMAADQGFAESSAETWSEEDNDPLFSNRDESAARGSAQPGVGQSETARSARQTSSGDAVRASRAAAADTNGTETEPESRGVADLNQARESRRPATPPTRVRTESAPARRDIEPSEVLVVNVMSREDELFSGAELLQVMITAGLKHGDMNIFHKHLDNDVDSPVIFSVANILNPGTFDLDDMDNMATRGVSLFLAMPAVISNRDAFEDMLRIAQQIRAALDGELRDDHRSVMTAQTIEHYRQRIQDYELRKLKAAQAQS